MSPAASKREQKAGRSSPSLLHCQIEGRDVKEEEEESLLPTLVLLLLLLLPLRACAFVCFCVLPKL
jgi:hypothetical protein